MTATDEVLQSSDSTRPLVLGYLRAHLLMTDNELANVKQDLDRCVHAAGYALGTVYMERVDRVPAAFGALLEAVELQKPEAIAVPNMLHLAVLGFPPQIIYYLQTISGVRVLVANSPP